MAEERLIVSWKLDLKPTIRALDKTTKSIESIENQTLGIIGRTTARVVTQAMRESLPKRSKLNLKNKHESLRKQGFTYKVKKGKGEVNIYPKTLNYGSDIFPQASVLSFGHFGATQRARSFTINPHYFVQSGDKYIEMGLYQSEVDKMIEKTLIKNGW